MKARYKFIDQDSNSKIFVNITRIPQNWTIKFLKIISFLQKKTEPKIQYGK